MRDNDWTKILGWPGYRVWRSEIDESAKRLKLWVRRKRDSLGLVCSGCGCRVHGIAEVVDKSFEWDGDLSKLTTPQLERVFTSMQLILAKELANGAPAEPGDAALRLPLGAASATIDVQIVP